MWNTIRGIETWIRKSRFFWRITASILVSPVHRSCALTVWRFRPYQKDGKLVAEEIGHLHPDVVILDFFLPRMDAIGVMKNTASLGLAHRPQFMVMSSFDNPNLEREAMLAGAITISSKPFDSDEMAERS